MIYLIYDHALLKKTLSCNIYYVSGSIFQTDKLRVTEQVLENAQIVWSAYQQAHAMFAGSSQDHTKDVLVRLQLQYVMLILQQL